MRAAAVDRAGLVPIQPQRFEECTAWATEIPDRFVVAAPLGVDVMTAPYPQVCLIFIEDVTGPHPARRVSRSPECRPGIR